MSQIRAKDGVQLSDRFLVPPGWRRAHEQLAVDDLVSIAVVRQIAEIVDGPVPLEMRHVHRIDLSASSEQAGMPPTYGAWSHEPSSKGRPHRPLCAIEGLQCAMGEPTTIGSPIFYAARAPSRDAQSARRAVPPSA